MCISRKVSMKVKLGLSTYDKSISLNISVIQVANSVPLEYIFAEYQGIKTIIEANRPPTSP